MINNNYKMALQIEKTNTFVAFFQKLHTELNLLLNSFIAIPKLELLQRDCMALTETKMGDLWTEQGNVKVCVLCL